MSLFQLQSKADSDRLRYQESSKAKRPTQCHPILKLALTDLSHHGSEHTDLYAFMESMCKSYRQNDGAHKSTRPDLQTISCKQSIRAHEGFIQFLLIHSGVALFTCAHIELATLESGRDEIVR